MPCQIKKQSLFLIAALLVFFMSFCKKKKEQDSPLVNASITGKVQKGPYKNGTPIVIYELNPNLGQTGKSFAATIESDAGNFSLSNVTLASNFVLVTANGFYFSEHYNQVLSNQLYLEALADVSGSSNVNVNILTHIIRPRIETLVAAGNSFASAKSQAQSELCQVMGASFPGNDFENMDLSNNNFLMAMSLLFQRRTQGFLTFYNYTSELSSLLSNFRSDFKDNGQIDIKKNIDTLLHNANRIELIDAKENTQNYFSTLGITFSSMGYEQYIYSFQKKHAPVVHTNIFLPDSASYGIEHLGPSVTKAKNPLAKNTKVIKSGWNNAIFSATVPCDSSLVIKYTFLGSALNSINIHQPYYGWKITNQTSTSFILTAQRKNYPNAVMMTIGNLTDSARIEYYFNGSTSPNLTKYLRFN